MDTKALATSSKLHDFRHNVVLLVFTAVLLLELIWWVSYRNSFKWAFIATKSIYADKDVFFDVGLIFTIFLEWLLLISVLISHRGSLKVQKNITVVLSVLCFVFIVYEIFYAAAVSEFVGTESVIEEDFDESYILHRNVVKIALTAERRMEIVKHNTFFAARHCVYLIYFLVRFALIDWFLQVVPPKSRIIALLFDV